MRIASVACGYGLGAVISQGMDDGQERPVAYASQTLSSSESNYPQIMHFWGKEIPLNLRTKSYDIKNHKPPLLASFGLHSATALRLHFAGP